MLRRPAAYLAATMVLGLLAGPAAAHDGSGGDPDQDAAAHARTDLAGESMARIERDTARHATRRSALVLRRARVAARDAVSEDPGVAGRWSEVVDTPVVPVFQAVLPDGKVLMWDSVGTSNPESYPVQDSTRAMVWDPTSDTAKRVDVHDANIFCAGYTQLPDGNVLVVGGNKDAQLDGLVDTHVFDWRTETWSRGPDMSSARWYPAVAALSDGEAVIVGGGSDRAEVYQSDGTLRLLLGLYDFADRLYAMLVPRGDGRVELVGPQPATNTMTTDGEGSLDGAELRDQIERDYGSFATYAPDRTLVAGGGQLAQPDGTEAPTATAVVVDTSGATTTFEPTSPMAFPRRQHDLTVLPDGSVLATGGESRAEDPLVDLDHPVLNAERWSPATGAWTTLAAASRIRQYHSSATLLPDGRVLTGGGGVCKVCVAKGYLEENLEYYSPPYLFDADGSAATRPTVDGVPDAITPGSTFTATSSSGSSIRKVALVKLGATTHSTDQGQRYVPLSFRSSGGTLTIKAPATNRAAPPGYYMLFAISRAGVPSVASMVRVGSTGPQYLGNLSRGKPATQSSTYTETDGTAYAADRAVDGSTDGRIEDGSLTHTLTDPWSWWQVDLQASYAPRQVVVWNRTDCCDERLSDYWVFVSDKPFDTTLTPAEQRKVPGTWSSHQRREPEPTTTLTVPGSVRGRYVMVQQGTRHQFLSLAEVEVFGTS